MSFIAHREKLEPIKDNFDQSYNLDLYAVYIWPRYARIWPNGFQPLLGFNVSRSFSLVVVLSFAIFGSYYECSDAILHIHFSSENPGSK